MSAATATIVGGVIAAGGALGAAAIQSHAAGKAANAQTAAAGKANARLDPYATAGYGAISNLQGMIGRPANGAIPAPGATGIPSGGLSALAVNTQQEQNKLAPPAIGPGQPASAQTASGFVTLRSPDGKETQQVPAAQAPFYLSKGAQVIQ